jgi:hypothetical protein
MPLDGFADAADYMSKALMDLMRGETPSCVDRCLFYMVCCFWFVEVFLLTAKFLYLTCSSLKNQKTPFSVIPADAGIQFF